MKKKNARRRIQHQGKTGKSQWLCVQERECESDGASMLLETICYL